MTRNDLLAYLLTAILGGALAAYIDGLLGMLAVFTGLAVVGFLDLVAHLRER